MTKEVKTIEGSRLLTEGIRLMRDAHIGSVVVVEGYRPAGIFTEQDLVSKIADDVDTLKVTMAQVMSMPLTTILPTASVWDALALTGRKNIRHLPVVHEDRLVGILTERDVVRLILSQHDLLFESISETYLLLRKIGSEGFLSRYGMDNPPTRWEDSRSPLDDELALDRHPTSVRDRLTTFNHFFAFLLALS